MYDINRVKIKLIPLSFFFFFNQISVRIINSNFTLRIF